MEILKTNYLCSIVLFYSVLNQWFANSLAYDADLQVYASVTFMNSNSTEYSEDVSEAVDLTNFERPYPDSDELKYTDPSTSLFTTVDDECVNLNPSRCYESGEENECGGVIKVGIGDGVQEIISYKPNSGPGLQNQSQSCIWTIINENYLNIDLNLTYGDFRNTGKTLEFYFLTNPEFTPFNRTILTRTEPWRRNSCDGHSLKTVGNHCKLNARIVYVVFKSNNSTSDGFEVQLTVSNYFIRKFNYHASHFTFGGGNISFLEEPFDRNHLFSWTFVPEEEALELTIAKFNTTYKNGSESLPVQPDGKNCFPSLRLFQISNGKTHNVSLFCQEASFLITFVSKSPAPLVLVFETDRSFGAAHEHEMLNDIQFYWNDGITENSTDTESIRIILDDSMFSEKPMAPIVGCMPLSIILLIILGIIIELSIAFMLIKCHTE